MVAPPVRPSHLAASGDDAPVKLFPAAHATHPQWGMAAGLVLAQLRAQMALPTHASAPTLGLLYITDHYATHAQDILDHLSAELPEVTDWSGTVGVGVCGSNVEYFDEPALSVMLCDLPADQYRVFSGWRRWARALRAPLAQRLRRTLRWCTPRAARPTWPSWWPRLPAAPTPVTCLVA